MSVSCSRITPVSSIQEVGDRQNNMPQLTIEAINLSEDLSRISTKNDELLLLTYELTQDDNLDSYIFKEEFILDEKIRSKSFAFRLTEEQYESSFLFILMELDSDTPIERIDPVLRIYHKEIVNSLDSNDYNEIEKYLADEDILGAKIIKNLSIYKSQNFIIKGIHKLDRYEYLISLNL